MQARYEPVHGYLSIVVCVLGTLFNLLNILVLTHKDLRSNPINLILTGLHLSTLLITYSSLLILFLTRLYSSPLIVVTIPHSL
jgi:hypothetical protein